MSLEVQHDPKPSTKGEIAPEFTAFRQFFDRLRADIDERSRDQKFRLDKAERTVAKLVTSVDASMIDIAVTVGRKLVRVRKPLSDLSIVKTAVETFGAEDFTLDALVARIAREFPLRSVSRDAVSRRLHDLRKHGAIRVVQKEHEMQSTKTRSYFAYRRRLAGPTPRDS